MLEIPLPQAVAAIGAVGGEGTATGSVTGTGAATVVGVGFEPQRPQACMQFGACMNASPHLPQAACCAQV